MQGLMQSYPLTVRMIIERMESHFAHKRVTTLRGGEKRITSYGQLIDRVRKLSAALRNQRLKPGDFVSTLMWNCQEHLETYLAVPAMGGVVHTINARVQPAAITFMLAETRPRMIIADLTLLDTLLKATLPDSVETVLVVGTQEDAPMPAVPGQKASWLSFEDFLASTDIACSWPDLDENSACGACYTSGTTGKMKGVLYSHRSTVLHAMAMMNVDGIALSEHDVCMTVVPMFHAHGWGFPHGSCLSGASQALSVRQADPETLADLIEDAGVTIATAVPTVWINMLEKIRSGEIPPKKLASLRRLPIGGAAVSADLMNGFADLGITVQHCWGMTEVSPLGLVSTRRSGVSDTEWSQLRLRQGISLAGCEMRVMNDKGARVPSDGFSGGELQMRGPWVADSYFDPDKPGHRGGDDKFETDMEGRRWLKTGDIATIDEHGYVKIVDRDKDLIKSGGEWISSLDLESALSEHPAVHEVAVVAIPDAVWQERPLAYVALSNNWCGPSPDFASYLEPRFPRWQIPERFIVLGELPKGATGKINKMRLRQLSCASAESISRSPDRKT
ncbi:MAG: AMP-binding protein [Pusillimonas sp.]